MFQKGRFRKAFQRLLTPPQLALAGGPALFDNSPLLMAGLPPEFNVPGGAGGGGADLDPDDFDYKKGNKAKFIGVVAVVLALGAGVAFAIHSGSGEEEMTVPQAAEQMKNIFVLPKDQQMAAWKKWASAPGESSGIAELKSEAIKQIAWAQDPEGVALATNLLKSSSEKLQSMAATVLYYYGKPAAESAKPVLLEALKKAGPGSKPQIAWALVTLGEASAFDQILDLYRQGQLSSVMRLGGGTAFDPNQLVAMVPIDKIASLAGDSSPAVRQLVATVLSRNATTQWTDTLIQLLGDQDAEVARQAAPGLGKIGDQKARDPLIAKLKDADKDSREKYLEALKNGSGGQGLVLALYAFANAEDPKIKWYRKKEIMELVDGLNDPRAADSLYEYSQVEEHVHWQYRVARALAEVGDVRAVPGLAKRLRMDPLKVYSDQYDWEMLLKRDDKERVEAARMLADLAVLHPEQSALIRKQSEDALIFWAHELRSPHANALRALAAMGSTKDIDALRAWAKPGVPLPKEGQAPPLPNEFVIAQSALRYVGMTKDDKSFSILTDMLKSKPEKLNIANDAMYQGGLAVLGMSLNAVGKGAADGLSEYGDPKGFKPLLDFVIDEKQNENARENACAALAWTAQGEDILKVAEKIGEYKSQEPNDAFRRRCLLEALVQRPVPGTAGALLGLLTPDQSIETRHQVARAIAKSGIDADTEAKLFELMKDDALMTDATLALILGGSPGSAARAVALFADKSKEAMEELHDLWFKSFGFWSTEDLEQGLLFRYVDNATAISRVEVRSAPQEWASALLARQFEQLIFDNGPHSFTRVVLRNRLLQMAKGQDVAKGLGAIRVLSFLKEQGCLMSLRDTQGPVGKAAEQAFFELVNPKALDASVAPASSSLTK